MIGDFKYATQNFKEPRELPWHPNFGQKWAKIEQNILSRSHRSSYKRR